MQDKELHQHILGLTSPWTVRDVNLDTENQEIRIQVDHPRGTKFCCLEDSLGRHHLGWDRLGFGKAKASVAGENTWQR
jgi:hypothetical protein